MLKVATKNVTTRCIIFSCNLLSYAYDNQSANCL